jgi:uncharacterized protein (UPF0333 family)
MIEDSKGQLSVEYLLIILVIILAFIAIVLPTLEFGINNSIDMTNIVKIKSECIKITNAVDIVYSNGIGSKKTVIIDIPHGTTIHFQDNKAYFDYLLNDKSIKRVYLPYNCPNFSTSIAISKGINKIAVEWDKDRIKISFL